MKAFVVDVPPELIEARRRSGANQWDEMWEGVLHMAAMPVNEHQNLGRDLLLFLTSHWARPRKALVFYEVNLASIDGWPTDYRIPDLLLLSQERFRINKGKYFEGAPDAVIEIHSSEDEAYEKLPFYERLGIPEVWIIDRDTRAPEIRHLRRRRYRLLPADINGWVRSPNIGVEMRASERGKLAIRLTDDDSSLEELPNQELPAE